MNNSILSGLMWKFGERICAQGVTFIVSVILARLLMPEAYGIVTMVNIFISIANVFVSDGFGCSLIQKRDADELDFNSMFYISLGVSVITYVVLFLTAPTLAVFFNQPLLSSVIRVFALRLPVSAVSTIQHAYVSRHMIFRKFFFSTLIGTIISGLVGILLAFHGWGVWALIMQYMVNSVTDCIVLFATVPWRPGLQFSGRRAAELMRYGWKIFLTGLISVSYGQLRAFAIGRRYTAEDLAYYNYGERFPALVVNNVDASVSGVLFPAMSNNGNDIVKVKEMTRKTMRMSAYVIFPLMVILAMVAEHLVICLLTEKWLPCVFFLRIFCLEKGLSPYSTANLQAIKAIGRSDVLLKMEVLKKSIGMLIVIVAMQISVEAIGYSSIIITFYAVMVNIIPNGKLLGYTALEQMRDLFPIMVVNVLMAGVIYFVSRAMIFINVGMAVLLIIQVLAGIVSYIALSYMFHISELMYLKNVLPNLFRRKDE